MIARILQGQGGQPPMFLQEQYMTLHEAQEYLRARLNTATLFVVPRQNSRTGRPNLVSFFQAEANALTKLDEPVSQVLGERMFDISGIPVCSLTDPYTHTVQAWMDKLSSRLYGRTGQITFRIL